MKKITDGTTDFKELITEDYYYVDKTMYLELLQKTGKKIVYLRPRRFGKTLFTSMMFYYYDINSKDDYDYLFKDTYVYKHPTYTKVKGKKVPNRNSYYVLKFDFSGMSGKIDKQTEDTIMNKFNEWLIYGISIFLEHYNFEWSIPYDLDPSDLMKRFLAFFNEQRKGKTLYIIIDEYDNFTNSILKDDAKLFSDILGKNGFVKDFYAAIKSACDTIVDRVFITGVCSISLDSMTSGFNIAKNITTIKKYNSMTALTYEEVKKLVDTVVSKGESNKVLQDMEANYDGYKFSKDGDKVFNPNLVMYYLSYLLDNGEIPENLMDANVISDYDKIKDIIKLYNNNLYQDVLTKIFTNDYIIANLKVNFELRSEEEIKSGNYNITEDDIVSLLFYFGYLTLSDIVPLKGTLFKIPNKVIKDIYYDYYMSMLKEYDINLDRQEINSVVIPIINNGNIIPFCDYLSKIFKHASNELYKTFGEKYIQVTTYALLNQYDVFKVYMEYPSNDNFIDIMLFKTDNSNYNVMIEFKYIQKKDYTENKLKQNIQEGKEQIEKYKEDERIPIENIKYYVVVFSASKYEIEEVE